MGKLNAVSLTICMMIISKRRDGLFAPLIEGWRIGYLNCGNPYLTETPCGGGCGCGCTNGNFVTVNCGVEAGLDSSTQRTSFSSAPMVSTIADGDSTRSPSLPCLAAFNTVLTINEAFKQSDAARPS